MGWWPWSSGSDSGSHDAVKNLDPSLREFLNEETPRSKPSSSPPTHTHPPASTARRHDNIASNSSASQQHVSYTERIASIFGHPTGSSTPSREQPSSQTPSNPPTTDPNAAPLQIPPESLFPDGRYAHLWSTYEPISRIESRHKTDQDRLSDVVRAFRDRRADSGRAALENCTLEYIAQRDCFLKGSWSQRATMCQAETLALNHCYETQTKFLTALGWTSLKERTEDDEDKMMEWSDRLYQQLKAQEAEIDLARAEGRDPPAFPPVLSRANVVAALGPDAAARTALGQGKKGWTDSARQGISRLEGQQGREESGIEDAEDVAGRSDEELVKGMPEGARKAYGSRLQECKTDVERQLEFEAIKAEYRAVLDMGEEVAQIYVSEQEQRRQRKAEGRETVGDRVKRWWGWR